MKCQNCGGEGPHYVPPSLGEEGFFHCEKKGVKPVKRGYYLALKFEERPELHSTIRYYPDVDVKKFVRIMIYLRDLFSVLDAKPFDARFGEEKWLDLAGGHRVLEIRFDSLPFWVRDLMLDQSESGRQTPFVMCVDRTLFVKVTGVALMHDGNDVVSWRL